MYTSSQVKHWLQRIKEIIPMSESAIKQQLQKYFDGLYYGDVALLSSVFHPKAQYCCTNAGELIHLNMVEYFDIVKHRPAPSTTSDDRHDRIIFIDKISETTALAKVQCVIKPKYFTDLLSLIFIEGRWQIISKVFDFQLHKFTAQQLPHD